MGFFPNLITRGVLRTTIMSFELHCFWPIFSATKIDTWTYVVPLESLHVTIQRRPIIRHSKAKLHLGGECLAPSFKNRAPRVKVCRLQSSCSVLRIHKRWDKNIKKTHRDSGHEAIQSASKYLFEFCIYANFPFSCLPRFCCLFVFHFRFFPKMDLESAF
jgi:hypothetical protein